MTHDQEADWASSEIARHFQTVPSDCFNIPPHSSSLSTWASHEGKNIWPHADGVVVLEDASLNPHKIFNIAVEYKRPNEGLHGILTAMGQAQAYLRKGYAGSAIVIPDSYRGLTDSGKYVRDVLELTSKTQCVGVFVYTEPDLSKALPFAGKMRLAQQLQVDLAPTIRESVSLGRTEAQWVHLREGSSDPDAFFRYLQSVKLMGGDDIPPSSVNPPSGLTEAIQRLSPGCDPAKYLSSTVGDKLSDFAWRHFWFKYVLTRDMMVGWTRGSSNEFKVNHVLSGIRKFNGTGVKKFFSGRTDSNKEQVVAKLNAQEITEEKAWEVLAKKFRERAHSYREDIDSGLEFIGYIEEGGHLSDEGYRFVNACERSGDPNTGAPRSLLLASLLQKGGLSTFLHYVFRLSEEVFNENPLAFTVQNANGVYIFQSSSYLEYIEDKLANEIRAMRKVSARGGMARKPFQAELALLRGFGLVGRNFRIGIGMTINWPKVQNVMDVQG